MQSKGKVFNIVSDWTVKKLKSRTCNNRVDPLRLFITGGAGVGKSHLAKTISSYLLKTFSFHSGSPDKPKILSLAPIGVAAINIDGTTINTGLSINPNTPSFLVKKPDLVKSKLRCDYSEVEFVIIDEILMVSNITMLHIHKSLCEIFGCSEELLFLGRGVIAVGDLL